MRTCILLALLLMAACVPNNIPPAPTATGFVPQMRGDATVTPVPWLESGAAITLNNVARIKRLGRLDTIGTPSTVFVYAFSPDGARLAGLNNEHLIAWNLVTGSIVFYTSRSGAQWVFYAPDKSEIYTLDNEGNIDIHDADTGADKAILTGHAQFGNLVAYSPYDGWLALGGSNGEVKVWDVAARQSLVTIKAHESPVSALAFSPDGKRLATGGLDGRVKVWDWRGKQAILSLEGSASRLAFSPDGTQLAVGENAYIDLWDVAANKRTYRLPTGPGGSRDVLLYAPDGSYLINGGSTSNMMVWDVKTGKFINNLPDVGGENTSAAFSADGHLLATSVLGGPVSLWNMTQITQTTLSRANLDFGVPQALYVDWSPDGFLLTIFEAAGPVQLWGIEKPS